MAIFHRAVIKPTKEELLRVWMPEQPWGPSPTAAIDVVHVPLTPTWPGQADPVVLAEVKQHT